MTPIRYNERTTMPFRCRTCSKIVPNDDAPVQCSENKPCDLERIAVIHLATKNGTGRLIGKTVVSRMDQGKEVEEQVAVRLHCQSTKPDALITNVEFAATCPTCLATLPTPTPEQPDQLDEPAPVPPLDEAQQHADQLDEPGPS